MNLTEFKEKCKSDRVFIALVIVFVGIGAFGLGRLSKIEAGRQGISIEAPSQVANVIMAEKTSINANIEPKNDVNTTNIGQNSSTSDGGQARTTPPGADSSGLALPTFEEQKLGGQVVASKNGTKYHFPWCSGAKTISEANKIYFNSAEEARAAGYTPAANCKGLK